MMELERALPLRRGRGDTPSLALTFFFSIFTISHCTIPDVDDATQDHAHAYTVSGP
jgi:hypothetical protein